MLKKSFWELYLESLNEVRDKVNNEFKEINDLEKSFLWSFLFSNISYLYKTILKTDKFISIKDEKDVLKNIYLNTFTLENLFMNSKKDYLFSKVVLFFHLTFWLTLWNLAFLHISNFYILLFIWILIWFSSDLFILLKYFYQNINWNKFKRISMKKFSNDFSEVLNVYIYWLKEQYYQIILLENLQDKFKDKILKNLSYDLKLDIRTYKKEIENNINELKNYLSHFKLKDLKEINIQELKLNKEQLYPYKEVTINFYEFLNETKNSKFSDFIQVILKESMNESQKNKIEQEIKILYNNLQKDISFQLQSNIKERIKELEEKLSEIYYYKLFKEWIQNNDTFYKEEVSERISELDVYKQNLSIHIQEIRKIIDYVNVYSTDKINKSQIEYSEKLNKLKL